MSAAAASSVPLPSYTVFVHLTAGLETVISALQQLRAWGYLDDTTDNADASTIEEFCLAAHRSISVPGIPGATPWDPSLGECMRQHGRGVHEESVFDLLAEELARPDF